MASAEDPKWNSANQSVKFQCSLYFSSMFGLNSFPNYIMCLLCIRLTNTVLHGFTSESEPESLRLPEEFLCLRVQTDRWNGKWPD